jgi:putative component of membrane protein insertase Oxa1/YidC/SpoIIIJ protein YidD
VFGTALEAKAVERIETDHRRVLRIGAVHAGGYDVVSREEHIQAIT